VVSILKRNRDLKDLENIFILKNLLYNILNVKQERKNKIGLTDKEEKKEEEVVVNPTVSEHNLVKINRTKN
jgi:hypothetical protein